MSSFKRRSTKQTPIPAGTRILPGSTSTFTTSTGIPSLDDILGGGLPLSCSQLVLAPDVHSAYGELVQKYFVAQGLASGQNVWIVSECARDFLEGCMWLPASDTAAPTAVSLTAAEEEEEIAKDHDTKIKIAWRYEQMKQFQTTVSSSTHTADEFCRVFDLTSRLPASTIDRAIESKQLRIFEVKPDKHPGRDILQAISDALSTSIDVAAADAPVPTRVCVPTLGFPSWGDVEPQHITYFLYSLRHILRTHPNSCASLSLPPHLCSEKWGGPGWVQKLGWLTDASISLTAFSGNPGLAAMFPSHHGFVHIHSLPAPSTLLPPSDRFSTLRGLSSSGENNLAFKCMRKRLIFETLHLDVEGGVGERRTAPSTTATIASEETSHTGHSHDHGAGSGGALLEVQVEHMQAKVETVSLVQSAGEAQETSATTIASIKKPKQRKKVAFTSDRPDLYDF